MTIITNIDAVTFEINGIRYQKNFISLVSGNNLRIVDVYDVRLELSSFLNYSEYEVNGITFGNVADLQEALLPVLFTRESLNGVIINGNIIDVELVGDTLTFELSDGSFINIVLPYVRTVTGTAVNDSDPRNVIIDKYENSTTVFPLDLTTATITEDLINVAVTAINSNAPFSFNLGEQPVFFFDVVSTTDVERFYFRETTGVTPVTSVTSNTIISDGSVRYPINDYSIDLGDIGDSTVEDAFNNDPSEPFTISGQTFITATQSSVDQVWYWNGGDGNFGNSATPAVSSDFILLKDGTAIGQSFLISGNNLSDVQSASDSRDNLDVYSKSEVYTQNQVEAELDKKANLTGDTFTGDITISKLNPRFTLDRASGDLSLIRYYDNGIQTGGIGYNYTNNKFIFKDASANDIFTLDRNGDLPSGDILNLHNNKWFTIRNGGNIGSGRQYLFMDIDTWSANNSGADVDNANNFHYYDTGDSRVEFETDGEMAFYIEGGVSQDAWYGLQENGTHHWSFGSKASQNGDLFFTTGFGIGSDNKVTFTKTGKIGQGVDDPMALFHSRVDQITDLHQPVPAHRDWLLESNNDGVLQIAANNAGTVGTAIILTNQQSASDGRHWVIENTGILEDNNFVIGYKNTSSSGENILGTLTPFLTIKTNGETRIGTEGQSNQVVLIGDTGEDFIIQKNLDGTATIENSNNETIIINGNISLQNYSITSIDNITVQGILKLPVYSVATLPSPQTGMKCFVNDATGTTFYSVVSGGGTDFVPVFHDGTNWRIG